MPVRLIVPSLVLAGLLSACGNVAWPPPGSGPQPVHRPATQAIQSAPSANAIVVQPGDTVYSYSRRYGIPVRAIIDANGLRPPYVLIPGRRLVLPVVDTHIVSQGDTLYGISRRYGVDVSALARINNLGEPFTIVPGQRLRLPGGVQASTAPRPEQTAEQGSSSSVQQASVAAPRTEPPPPVANVPAPPPRSSARFAWPVKGEVVSSFGPKAKGLHNDGINIVAPRGTEVLAAENGVVAYAGNELRGFGNLLLIRHADGWVTAYAHNDQLLVKRGDQVKRGQPVARVGSTGNVTSPQLHFEIRQGKKAVDPMRHL